MEYYDSDKYRRRPRGQAMPKMEARENADRILSPAIRLVSAYQRHRDGPVSLPSGQSARAIDSPISRYRQRHTEVISNRRVDAFIKACHNVGRPLLHTILPSHFADAERS